MPDDARHIPAFCPLCVSRCGCTAVVQDGRLVALEPDPLHPTGKALCAKGRAAPELVTARDRLLYPLRRTRPKGDADPGWQRISWDEALDTTAAALRRIAAESGPEAVGFAVTTPSATSISDALPWVYRLINSFGSPNTCNANEICSWHREFAGSFVTGAGIGTPDFERAGCILLWGFNPSTSWLAAAGAIADARARGAKLVVIDPRRIGLAVKADHWLSVRPGTDGAVALSLGGVMIEQGWFDADFVRAWTNAPFLVRDDDGTLLRDGDGLVAWDEGRQAFVTYDPLTRSYSEPTVRLALQGGFEHPTATGTVCCRPVFEHFVALCRTWPPERAAAIAGIDAAIIRQTAHTLWHHRPLTYFTWTGLEQHTSATHTARAHATLHALTGCIDVPGGNVQLAQVPVNDIMGAALRPPGTWQALGRSERPLGLATGGWVTSDELYRGILDAQPYRVRGLVGFGANLLLSRADSARGAAALKALEFHVQADLYLTPTANYADIVLPIASAFEREGLAVGFRLDQAAAGWLQFRPQLVAPRGEARADIDVVFDLAVRLGLGEHFWNGDVEAGLRHHLAPTGLTPETLRAAGRGVGVPLQTSYRKYRDRGFATPSGKLEIFSEALQGIGEPALPEFRERPRDTDTRLPLLLTSTKSPVYCHSQHRNLPQLRRRLPEPVVEISPATAASRGIAAGDWVAIITQLGRVRARAR
ncbi:MAG TPA: molybdopterin-dependent oxidoreductase, partial [Acetobacteraceae bacterium]|nr:molybdopterin-dependent oxidoreductase [Acetobacteraceae bacterium]